MAGPRQFAPPPTKFGSPLPTAQTKAEAASPMPRVHVPPPLAPHRGAVPQLNGTVPNHVAQRKIGPDVTAIRPVAPRLEVSVSSGTIQPMKFDINSSSMKYVSGGVLALGAGYALYNYLRTRQVECRVLEIYREGDDREICCGLIEAYATHLQPGDICVYEISWNAQAAPVGHPGFAAAGTPVVENQARGFVEDLSGDGKPFDKFRKCYFKVGELGRCYYVRDKMRSSHIKPGGRWYFRLRVKNFMGIEVARSQVATVDWMRDVYNGQENERLGTVWADKN